MKTIALDLGVKKIVWVEVNEAGKVIEEKTLPSMQKLREALGPNTPRAKVAFEACREGWALANWLRKCGHEPVMVDTTRVRRLGIGHHGKKNDEVDARVLAEALAQERLPLAHILSEAKQKIRLQQNVRQQLVKQRANQVTMVRSLVRAQGETLKSGATENFLKRVEEAELSEETKLLIAPLLKVLEIINVQIVQVEIKLHQLTQEDPTVELLCTAPGVGVVIATAFVAVIDDVSRFKRAHQLESYLGLTPKESTTGGKRRLGSITKEGNGYLRSLLVQGAWSILRQKGEDPLTLWAKAVGNKRGRKIAAIALARKLAGVLWAMWRKNKVYDARILALDSQQGLQHAAEDAAERAKAMQRVEKKIQRRRATWERLLTRHTESQAQSPMN